MLKLIPLAVIIAVLGFIGSAQAIDPNEAETTETVCGCDRCPDVCDPDPPPPPPPPAPPPPPPPPPPPEEFSWTLVPDRQEYQDSFDEVIQQESCGDFGPCILEIRCKRYVFRDVWKNFRGFLDIDAIKYSGGFRVCYHPYGGGIYSVTDRWGDASEANWPWSWEGNDPGYPNHSRDDHWVVFRYRGSAHICLIQYGCGPTKHPWVTYVFRDTGLYGSIERSIGVV
jgi:hypothetical protein